MGKKRNNVLPSRKPDGFARLRRALGHKPIKPARFGRQGVWQRTRRWFARYRLHMLGAVLLALALFDGTRGGAAAQWSFLPWVPEPTADDPEAAWFQLCAGPVRYTCVIDGDTIWYEGEKYRLLDIDAPEVFSPECRREAELGERATYALRDWLNEGPFTLTRDPMQPDRDRYHRLLRSVTREGGSLREAMIRIGVAHGYRAAGPDWCD